MRGRVTASRSRIAVVACVAIALVLCGSAVAKLQERKYSDDSERQAVDQSRVTYRANEPFDLVGEADPASSENGGSISTFSQSLPWTGTMRFTVSQARWCETPEQAGFSQGECFGLDGCTGYVVVDVTIENLDASVKTRMEQAIGGAGFPLPFTMDGAEVAAVSGPAVALRDGADTEKARGYLWASKGTSATYRVCFGIMGGPVPDRVTLGMAPSGYLADTVAVDLGDVQDMRAR